MGETNREAEVRHRVYSAVTEMFTDELDLLGLVEYLTRIELRLERAERILKEQEEHDG